MSGRHLCIGDIHGDLFGLADVLHQCGFKDDDTLISLGDVVDGGVLTRSVIDVLVDIIPNVINTVGNHDRWCLEWMLSGKEKPLWWNQGGRATAMSYGFDYKSVPKSHIEFLAHSIPYYIDDQNRVYVHGGFDPLKPIAEQSIEVLTWDRDLLCNYAPNYLVEEFDHVFVGHTSTQYLGTLYDDPIKRAEMRENPYPVTLGNVTGMDTGGGWDGKLSIMDVDTFEVWQSDINANMQTALISTLDLKY